MINVLRDALLDSESRLARKILSAFIRLCLLFLRFARPNKFTCLDFVWTALSIIACWVVRIRNVLARIAYSIRIVSCNKTQTRDLVEIENFLESQRRLLWCCAFIGYVFKLSVIEESHMLLKRGREINSNELDSTWGWNENLVDLCDSRNFKSMWQAVWAVVNEPIGWKDKSQTVHYYFLESMEISVICLS